MTGLDPELMSLTDRNRRIIAERLSWPDGVLAECERLDHEHPGWSASWSPENRYPGHERPAGFSASRIDAPMQRDANGQRIPTRVFAATVAELEEEIATVDAEVAVATAYRDRLWGSMRAMRSTAGTRARR